MAPACTGGTQRQCCGAEKAAGLAVLTAVSGHKLSASGPGEKLWHQVYAQPGCGELGT